MRRLAADVVCCWRLMGENEVGTLVALRANRAKVFDPAVSSHVRRTVKMMGNGVLRTFPITDRKYRKTFEFGGRNAGLGD